MKQTFKVGTIPSTKDKYFEEVKDSLINFGAITEDTADSKVVEKMNDFIDDVLNPYIPTWENIDISTYSKKGIKMYDYVYFHSNGIDCYGSNQSDGGIYHFNRITLEEKKIYTSGSYWQYFFEGSNGYVYIGSDNNVGIICAIGSSATQIYSTGYSWQYFFEDSKKNIYVSSAYNTAKGIVYIKNKTAFSIYSSGRVFKYFEDSKGNVYCSSSYETGLFYLNGSYTPKQIYSSFSTWTNFFESSNGDVYVSSANPNGNSGILVLNGSSTPYQIYNIGACWQYFYEASNGIIYVASSRNNSIENTGILCIKNGQCNLRYNYYYNWQYFIEDNDGNIYISNNLSNSNQYNSGLLMATGENIRQIYQNGHTWDNFMQNKDGIFYVSSKTSNYPENGILCVKNSNAQNICSDIGFVTCFIENEEGNVYAIESEEDSQKIVYINDENAYLIYNSIDNYPIITIRDEEIILSKTESPTDGDFLVIKSDMAFLTRKE